MSAWILMYLFVVVDQVRAAVDGYGGAFFIASMMTLALGVAALIGYSETAEGESVFDKKWFKSLKKVVICFWFVPVLMFITHTLLPTQKNLAILIGAGATYEAVTSEAGQRIGGKVIKLLEEKLDGAMEDGGDDPVNWNAKEKEEVKKES